MNQQITGSSDRQGLSIPHLLIVWAAVSAVLIVVFRHDIPLMRMLDPDDQLRLVQVRDLLAGQSWFDVHQYRISAPAGVLMHWSRLVDIPLAGMILLLRPLLGQPLAEQVTAVAVPLLTLLCALALAMRLTTRLFDRETGLAAGLLIAVSGPILHQMQPLRIDHHGWQVVCTLAALNGISARNPVKGGWVTGLSLAAGLAISIEGLPLAALFVAIAALRGLAKAEWRWLLHTMCALAACSIAIFLCTRGLADLAEHCDSISPMHLGVFAWGAAGCSAIAVAKPRNLLVTLGSLATVGAVAVGIVLLAAPQCARGAFASMDPLVRDLWLASIREGQPVFSLEPATIAALIGVVPMGFWGLLNLWRRADGAARSYWIEFAILLGGATTTGLVVSRAMTTAAAIAVIPAAWQLRQWLLKAELVPLARRLVLDLGMIVAVLPVIPVALLLAVLPDKAQPNAARSLANCNFRTGLNAVSTLPPTDIFAPFDIGPAILLNTHHRVVATGHHRAEKGMHDVMLAFLSPADTAHALVTSRHATMLVICTAAPESHAYANYRPKGLMADLLAGRVPAWLQPMPSVAGSNVVFWRVVG